MLRPFLETGQYAPAAAHRAEARARLAAAYKLDPDEPWLLAVAMMRPGDKFASYALLAQALGRLAELPWRLLIVGDGPTRSDVEAALAPFSSRAVLAGVQAPEALLAFYAAADLLIWPAVNEAYGMTLLEAQATGLPVVAGDFGGVSAVVDDGRTGLLAPPGDAIAFASAVGALIRDPARRVAMAAAALRRTAAEHDIGTASATLDRVLRAISGDRAA